MRTVGTEAFKKKSSSLRSSPVPPPTSSNRFDPFASHSSRSSPSSDLNEMFGNPDAFGQSSSSEKLPKLQQGSPSFLTPASVNHGMPTRHSSAPNVAALGNPSFAPTLSGIPQSPKLGSTSTKPASLTTPNYQFPASSGGRTSPYGGGNLMTGASSPLGFHAHSTGHLRQQPMGGGGGRGMRDGNRADPFGNLGNVKMTGNTTQGSTQADPFADLGNVKMGGTTGSSRGSSRPQPGPSGPATTGRPPAYQHHNHSSSGQKKMPTQQQQTAPPTAHATTSGGQKAPYKPNYSSSVLGDHSERRGPRSKTGQPEHYTCIYMYIYTYINVCVCIHMYNVQCVYTCTCTCMYTGRGVYIASSPV